MDYKKDISRREKLNNKGQKKYERMKKLQNKIRKMRKYKYKNVEVYGFITYIFLIIGTEFSAIPKKFIDFFIPCNEENIKKIIVIGFRKLKKKETFLLYLKGLIKKCQIFM